MVNLLLPQAVRVGIDDAVVGGDLDRLHGIAWLALAGFAILSAFVFIRHYLMSWVGSRVVADLRIRCFDHLLRMPPGFFQVRKSGALVSRLTSDIEMLQQAVGSELSISLRSLLTAVGGIGLLVLMSPTLALVMLITLPVLTVGAVAIGRLIRRRSREVQDLVADANSRLKEALVGIETVQIFQAEARESDGYGDRIHRAFETILRIALARGGFIAGVQFATYTALALIIWLGAKMVISGEMRPGELTAFMLYTIMVTGAFANLANMWANLQRALGASERIFELLSEQPAVDDPADPVPLPEVQGAVRFEGVSFCYPTRPEVQVLNALEFAIAPGETVALVGASGAGKSTIAALIQRFHDPDRGAVRLDDVDLRTLSIATLRRNIATVRQDPVLFSGSVAENIRYGVPDADDGAVRRASGDAHIADFIEGLPRGYDTLVGERGVRLSGGQRQRIAIARALLGDPRVLILDEATAHLDTTHEQLVQRALEKLRAGRTTVIIAHRLSTVRQADRILVIADGQLVEAGDHDTLLRDGRVYPELVRTQLMDDDAPTPAPDRIRA